jgi:hypothetical protein
VSSKNANTLLGLNQIFALIEHTESYKIGEFGVFILRGLAGNDGDRVEIVRDWVCQLVGN